VRLSIETITTPTKVPFNICTEFPASLRWSGTIPRVVMELHSAAGDFTRCKDVLVTKPERIVFALNGTTTA